MVHTINIPSWRLVSLSADVSGDGARAICRELTPSERRGSLGAGLLNWDGHALLYLYCTAPQLNFLVPELGPMVRQGGYGIGSQSSHFALGCKV